MTQDLHQLKQQLRAAERLEAIDVAQDSLLAFSRLNMPDPNHPDDVSQSLYHVAPHHRVIAEALERVEKGEIKRLAISVPPQHGKSQLASRFFPAWYMGRNPRNNIIFATYSGDFSTTFGNQVRSIMRSKTYRQIFPDVQLSLDSQSKTEQETVQGGSMVFSSREGSVTGRPADLFLIDDPIKDSIEANSPAAQRSLWEFYTKVAYTRLHNDSRQIVIQTRWSENDLIGRLCDPSHPEYDEELASEWTYINLPAILEDKHAKLAKALGLSIGSTLWPERFSLSHLNTAKKLNPQGFNALYMGEPAPEEGVLYTQESLRFYGPDDMPPMDTMRFYGASDHAVATATTNDATVAGCVGVAPDGSIWVLPDLVWGRYESMETVERMLGVMRFRRPQAWFAEGDVIGKTLGPFLRKRMSEERIYTPLFKIPTVHNKETRAASMLGRAQQGMLYLPKHAPWCADAVNELLKFPFGTHDDFVDFLSNIGLGLDYQQSGAARPVANDIPKEGTFGHLKWMQKKIEEQEKRASAMGGW